MGKLHEAKEGKQAQGKNEYIKYLIDHCHVTNKVRGLICSRCNTVLGLCEDNQHTLSQIIKYLKRQTSCTTISRKKNA